MITQNARAGKTVSRDKGVFIIGRDSHKSVFDAIALAECGVVLLPCYTEPQFGVSLGSSYAAIKKALETYPGQVFFLLTTPWSRRW